MYKTLEEAEKAHPDCLRFTQRKEGDEYYWFPKEVSRSLENVEYGKDHYAGVVSPHDGYVFKGKADYNDYLKRNNFSLRK